jgi:hypothetical protein
MEDISSDEDIERCSICLDYQNCESIPMECCNKLIHRYCLSEWLRQRNNCPLCRADQGYSHLSRIGIDTSFGNVGIGSSSLVIENELNNIFENFERIENSLGITGMTESVFDFDSVPNEIIELGISLPTRTIRRRAPYPYPYPYRLRRRRRRMGLRMPDNLHYNFNIYNEFSRINEFINNDLPSESIDNGITLYRGLENSIGITIDSRDMDEELGVSTVNIESSDNNININLNNDININLNFNDTTEYMSTISGLLNRINREINDISNYMNDLEDMEDLD